MCGSLFSLLSILLLTQNSTAQDIPTVLSSPPPRFASVRSLDREKGEIVLDIQVVAQNVNDQLRLLVSAAGDQRLALQTKPTYVSIDPFKLPLKQVKWLDVDGQEIDGERLGRLLKPGAMLLFSADGKAVDRAYLQLFKQDTLVLTIPADLLPVPYLPHTGGSISIRPLNER